MKDKMIAGLWSFAIILPLQAVCCLGPAALVSFVLSRTVGASYSTTMLVLGLSIMAAAFVAYWAKRSRGARPTDTHAPADEAGGSIAHQCCPERPGPMQLLGPVVVKVWTHRHTGRMMMSFDPARVKS